MRYSRRNYYRRNPDNPEIVRLLQELLANTYLLYIETQGAHWNVVGSDFPQLHTLFQTQYGELTLATDLIAEHIRTYNAPAPASAAEFLELATFPEINFTGTDPHAQGYIAGLIEGHKAAVRTAEDLGAITADALHTQNLAADRIEAHNKAIWMLETTINAPTSRRNPRSLRRRGRYQRRRNPWGPSDVARHNKRCAGRAKCRNKWPRIANAVLRKSGDEGRAIRIANWQTKRMGLRRRYY